jgi:hypothetical protein
LLDSSARTTFERSNMVLYIKERRRSRRRKGKERRWTKIFVWPKIR